MIKDVKTLIEKLGGTKTVMSLCGGVGKTTVSNWRVDNVIPERHRYRLYRECERRGIKVDPTLFGDSVTAA